MKTIARRAMMLNCISAVVSDGSWGSGCAWAAVKERRRVGRRLALEKSVRWWRILTWLWSNLDRARGLGKQRLVYYQEALESKGEHNSGH